jgi:hypothetical protein
MKSKRIQRKRIKGWKMPPNTVYVGRPSKWGNPYSMKDGLTRQEAVDLYENWIKEEIAIAPENLTEIKAELAGKDLACWCAVGGPCHANILLELANSTEGNCE